MNSERLNTFFLSTMLLIAFMAIAKLTQNVLQPLVIAVLLHFTLLPIVKFLTKLRIPRFIAILLMIGLILGLIYVLGIFFYSSLRSFVHEMPKYQDRFLAILEDIMTRFQIPGDLIDEFNWTSTLSNILVGWSSNFMSFLKALGIVLIFLMFVSFEAPYFDLKVRRAFHIKTSTRIFRMIHDINSQIGRYLIVKMSISLLTGFLIFLVVTWAGVDFAPIWGIIGFLFNFIPNIGSIFVVFLTSILAFVQFYPDWRVPLIVFIGTASIQMILGNLAEPKMQGDSLDLSPLLILVSLLFFGWLWGIVGMILSVPLMVIIKIISANIDALRPISVLMASGRVIREKNSGN
ncbi:AI-2E family transporter [Spirochaeta cellobiosiphila]|uniref:AI-2E family transporter n=1 Tax=Spirochaeta cellobiosiphila TaxID=504483 RepID=UPI000418AD53|nr:AI-2E family transporter [Spirochaeta cellobiosiphila]